MPELSELQKSTERIHQAVVNLFYGGQPERFTALDGMLVSSMLTQAEGGAVDAWFGLADFGDQTVVVVEVTDLLLALTSLEPAAFGVAHEYGHAFSPGLLARLGMENAGGDKSEVVADLGAAWAVYHANHNDWHPVLTAMEKAVEEGIFAADRKDNHPPGAERVVYVKQFIRLIESGKPFEDAAKEVLTGVKG